MAQLGYIVDAIDNSSDMLMVAKEKTHNSGLHINYTLQDMRTFKSHNKYSLITCINDGVNYLTSLNDVEMFFNNCSKYLYKDGLILFDISTNYKLTNMNQQFYAEESDDYAYIWSNKYASDSKLLTMDITLFTQIDEDIYERTSEIHVQRGHSEDEIRSLLKNQGFELIETYSEISLDKPDDQSERIHFLAKKDS